MLLAGLLNNHDEVYQMDFTALAATIDFAPVITFMTAAVTAGFAVRLALKGVTYAKSAFAKS